jgi:hypothetical protein
VFDVATCQLVRMEDTWPGDPALRSPLLGKISTVKESRIVKQAEAHVLRRWRSSGEGFCLVVNAEKKPCNIESKNTTLIRILQKVTHAPKLRSLPNT